ncbi:DUF4419 domain-containing protein [Nocardia goodfellowii]|uniref:DUF4419 domain-containing protein n=1 Tax=Nocardia goodfellowii TaxID=882446 RepID=A0ABS4QPZ8_9NOCA|nr:DUF4419 domain-containing protein [Nocardia goodfellowii]MBP2192716.1 hypothetical protein [Nocardia goodfellowii]
MVTFLVDAVTSAAQPLATRPLAEFYPDALLIGGDPETPMLTPDGVDPLLSAVGRAFAEHRPLVLSPDAVWLTIAQGLARHIRLHAEQLREQLVEHQGQATLTVTVGDSMPTDRDSWSHVVELFDKALSAETRYSGLFECDFSTSTAVERVAGRVVALDAYAEYFAMWMVCVCGIPSITLTGTVEDWREIRDRVDALADFGLETWCRALAPVIEEFVRAADGGADIAFWQRIYKPADAYGESVITGWITRLYPYLQGGTTYDIPNSMLELPLDEPREVTVDGRRYDGPGISSTMVPATLSRAVINVNDRVAGHNRAVALRAGLVGVAQDEDGSLRPLPGWHLETVTVDIDEVIDRIEREHAVTAAVPRKYWERVGADVAALYRRIGSATLFDGAWRILPWAEHRNVRVSSTGYTEITVMFELADGSCVGALDTIDPGSRSMITHWVRCRVAAAGDPSAPSKARLLGPLSAARVCGTSLPLLLTAALDHGGRITHTETGGLDRLLRRIHR